MTQETQTAAVICDRCGENTDTDGRGPRFGSLSASWGPGSQHPGEKYELHLCEPCFFLQVSNIKRERWAQAMFSDEADAIMADDEFGRVS